MNKHYALVATAVSSINKKGEGIWGNLVHYVEDKRATNNAVTPDQMKLSFKKEEQAASIELKADMGKNSTYRVAKGVLLKAVEHKLVLVDDKGNPRGKTDVERELESLVEKKEKSAKEKFEAAMLAATKQIADLEDKDLTAATAQAQALFDGLASLMLAAEAKRS